MLVAAPLVGRIPLAVLAGVLPATAIRMVEVGSVRVLVRANRADALVLVLTAAATLALDLVTAVIVGLVVAGALAYRLDGPLFFAAAHRFLLELTEISAVSVVILRMSHVTTMDGTGALVLRDAVEKLEQRGVTVLLSGVRDEHRRQLETHGVPMFATAPEAIDRARNQLCQAGLL